MAFGVGAVLPIWRVPRTADVGSFPYPIVYESVGTLWEVVAGSSWGIHVDVLAMTAGGLILAGALVGLYAGLCWQAIFHRTKQPSGEVRG
jgi:hypothetical protein